MNGLKFNNKHSFTDFGLVLKSYRNIKPALRKREIEIPGKDGGYTFPLSSYDKRIINCKFSLIDCATLQELRLKAREISNWLSGEEKELVFDDEPDRKYIATVFSEIIPSQIATTQEFTVDFECQPLAIGVELKQHRKIINNYEEYSIENIGTKEIGLGSQQGAIFIIRIKGSFDNISISINNNTIRYTEKVEDSEIVIDNCKGLVKQGDSNVIHNCSGDVGQFLTLMPGSNLIIVDGENLDVEITIEHKTLWR